MKKIFLIGLISILCISVCGYTFFDREEDNSFDLNQLKNYEKLFECEEIELCSPNASKSYMDYRAVNLVYSNQYQYIHNHCIVDKTGFLLNEENFIGVALGSYFGEIGTCYYFTLDSGVILPVVKVDEKDDGDVYDGCYHRLDNSVIEFVIDSDVAGDYFGVYANGLVLSGNFNNYDLLSGNIEKVEKVLQEKKHQDITYQNGTTKTKINKFYYGSGY